MKSSSPRYQAAFYLFIDENFLVVLARSSMITFISIDEYPQLVDEIEKITELDNPDPVFWLVAELEKELGHSLFYKEDNQPDG